MKKVLVLALMALFFAGCGKDEDNDDVVNKIDLSHYKQLIVGTWHTDEVHAEPFVETITFSSDGKFNGSMNYSLSVVETIGEMAGGYGNYYTYQYCALHIDGESSSFRVHENGPNSITLERMSGYHVVYNYERVK